MPRATLNGVSIEYAGAGDGFPLVLCHEFGGSQESWESQVRFFSRRYRVITYNARGYPPSDVPDDPEAYSQEQAAADLYELLRHLAIEQAFVAGLSMGGSTTLQFGLDHPEMARALIVAGVGTGSTDPDRFRTECARLADRIDAEGMDAMKAYAVGPTRIQLQRKDPTGWEEFATLLAGHSPLGSALTLRGVQGGRPPIYAFDERLRALDVPTLVMVGDEDAAAMEPSLFLKTRIERAGLVVFPQTGHAMNLEEPDLFNRTVLDFLTAVEAGKWASRPTSSGGGFLATQKS